MHPLLDVFNIRFDNAARRLFDTIGRWRRVDLQDLERETGFDRLTTKHNISILKTAQLLGEVTAPIEDFTIYYLTPEGLQTYEESSNQK